MAVLRLQLLDGFVLETAEAVIELPVGMQRLLAYLALRGPAHRCVVAGTLWPEVPEAQALASLRTAMWRMNRMLPGGIHSEGAAVAATEDMTVDSRDQETYTLRLLREHVDDEQWVSDGLPTLWPSELLPGWYDDWVVFERERLAQLRLHALEYAAALMTRHHRLDAALQLALEAVHSEPLRETSNAVLMEVYLAEGNVADAIHQYEWFRDLLRRELDLEPSPSLEELLLAPRAHGRSLTSR